MTRIIRTRKAQSAKRKAQMSGIDLRAYCKAAGLSQVQLARLVGFSRDAVAYWEAKAEVDMRWGASHQFAEVLGIVVFRAKYAHARSWGLSDPSPRVQQAQATAPSPDRQADRRVTCGAKTQTAVPCRLMSEPCKTRCKFHGGKSTGPKTQEGKTRIAEAQRTRWAGTRGEAAGCVTKIVRKKAAHERAVLQRRIELPPMSQSWSFGVTTTARPGLLLVSWTPR